MFVYAYVSVLSLGVCVYGGVYIVIVGALSSVQCTSVISALGYTVNIDR